MTVTINSNLSGVTGSSVSLASLISGEDQYNNWMQVADGGWQYYNVDPAQLGGIVSPNTNKALGTIGAAGDYLKSLTLNVTSNTASAVYLQDGSGTNQLSGTAGTNPPGTTTLTVTASSTTAAANFYAGSIISVTYTPTSGASTTFKRRIVSHGAFSAATSLAFTVTHALPAGATITAWAVEPAATSFELVPSTMAVGIYIIPLGIKSTLGPWKLSIDSGVLALAVGKFT